MVEKVGINNVNLATNVTVAPNPTEGRLVLHNNWENNNLTQATILNLNGQVVQKLAVNGNHNEYQLELPAGIYMISMTFENGVGSAKLVVR